VKGRTLFLALLAALSVLCASAVAGGQRPVVGTKGVDELSTAAGNDRVFARSGDDSVDGGAGHDRLRGGRGDDALFGSAGDDRLRGGQDNDFLDGGNGDDVLNGGGDGRDKDKIVCGEGHDEVVLGRGDVVLVEVDASEDAHGEDGVERPEAGEDDGCEKVKRVGGGREACSATDDGCEPSPCASGGPHGCEPEPCAAGNRGCEPVCPAMADECEPAPEDPCLARLAPGCDPAGQKPDPDEPVEAPAPDEA
jgi:hypothetical protein